MAGAVVLLGSATPAITTYHRARSGQLGYLSLTGRVAGRPLPTVELVDLREARPEGESSLSPPLSAALTEILGRGEQALLLLNRRGFAPFLLCADCGATFRCPNCAITLTFHRGRRQLRCHYCDYIETPPELCPACRGGAIEPQGAGTERLEEELAALFPAARIARMDRDTTTRKGAHQSLVERMLLGDLDILVGTQMVAKGHDFPRVTLVGVVGADSSLNLPDFRSAERTFALLCQVAGRAGRGETLGRVLIQTYSPEHYALVCAAGHDYEGFYEQEIACRQPLDYPPFGYLVNLVLSGNEEPQVQRAAAALADGLLRAGVGAEVLGPAPCPLARLRGKSRVQILL
jgi:primosomal protein N' (replication factor Y)